MKENLEKISFKDSYNYLYYGDNLYTLKLLLKKEIKPIDMIYIDPPYNTGKNFTFHDNFKIKKTKTQKLDFNSKKSSSHVHWREFMFPRLKMAHEILSEEGSIFISIDDNEVHNLRVMMDEIFGCNNFIATIIRQSGVAPRQDAKYLAIQHDYVIIYAKDSKKVTFNKKISDLNGFIHKDKHIEIRGRYRLNKLDRGSIKFSQSLHYPIKDDSSNEIWPGGYPKRKNWTWRWSLKKVQWGIENDFIVFKKGRNGDPCVYFKEYENVNNKGELKKRTNPYSTIILDNPNEIGNRDLKKIFKRKVFDYPKPVSFLKLLLRIGAKKDSLILDFFAGSGTTGHAVWELNKEDDGDRNFILIQLDEAVYDKEILKDFPTVADITQERLRRISENLNFKDSKYFRELKVIKQK